MSGSAMTTPSFVFTWAGCDGPNVKRFDSLESLMCFSAGWTRQNHEHGAADSVLLIVRNEQSFEVRA